MGGGHSIGYNGVLHLPLGALQQSEKEGTEVEDSGGQDRINAVVLWLWDVWRVGSTVLGLHLTQLVAH